MFNAVFDARLTYGSTPNSGIVEVLTDDGWLPVCYTNATFQADEFSWDDQTESNVLCRQLGYSNSSMLYNIMVYYTLCTNSMYICNNLTVNTVCSHDFYLQVLAQYHFQTETILMCSH